MRQTIHLWVQDEPGALMRVAGIITNKGANITGLTVRPLREQPGTAEILITADIAPRLRNRVLCEMNRLVQVLEANDISGDDAA